MPDDPSLAEGRTGLLRDHLPDASQVFAGLPVGQVIWTSGEYGQGPGRPDRTSQLMSLMSPAQDHVRRPWRSRCPRARVEGAGKIPSLIGERRGEGWTRPRGSTNVYSTPSSDAFGTTARGEERSWRRWPAPCMWHGKIG